MYAKALGLFITTGGGAEIGSVVVDKAASTRRIALEGEYDLTRRHEVAALFANLDGDGPVVVDLTNVTYMDSTILRELASLRLRSARRPIMLAGANEHIRRILKIVNFDQIFQISE